MAAIRKRHVGYVRNGVAGQIKMLQVLWKNNGGKAKYFVDAQIESLEIFGELRPKNARYLIAAKQYLLKPLRKADGVRYARDPVVAQIE